jgi:hypothetical protein
VFAAVVLGERKHREDNGITHISLHRWPDAIQKEPLEDVHYATWQVTRPHRVRQCVSWISIFGPRPPPLLCPEAAPVSSIVGGGVLDSVQSGQDGTTN